MAELFKKKCDLGRIVEVEIIYKKQHTDAKLKSSFPKFGYCQLLQQSIEVFTILFT